MSGRRITVSEGAAHAIRINKLLSQDGLHVEDVLCVLGLAMNGLAKGVYGMENSSDLCHAMVDATSDMIDEANKEYSLIVNADQKKVH